MPKRRKSQYPHNTNHSSSGSDIVNTALAAVAQCFHPDSSSENSDSPDRSIDGRDILPTLPIPTPLSQRLAPTGLLPATEHRLSEEEYEDRQQIERLFFNELIRINALFCTVTDKIVKARETTSFFLMALQQQEILNRSVIAAEHTAETAKLAEDFDMEHDIITDDSAIPTGSDFVILSSSHFFQPTAEAGAGASAANTITPQQPGLLARLCNLF